MPRTSGLVRSTNIAAVEPLYFVDEGVFRTVAYDRELTIPHSALQATPSTLGPLREPEANRCRFHSPYWLHLSLIMWAYSVSRARSFRATTMSFAGSTHKLMMAVVSSSSVVLGRT